MASRRLKRLQLMLSGVGLRMDGGDWLIEDQLLGCAYPKTDAALGVLREQGISILINLHERPHDESRLAEYGLTSLELPVSDFSTPTPEQLDAGIAAIDEALANGQRVAVHCGAGLGRTGTLLACYLVAQGSTAQAAIQRVREVRPGSIETGEQSEAIRAFAETIEARNEAGGP
jgi:atypical dual specificity phosphatase